MQVSVEMDKCCGAGQCVLVAPEVFDQRDEDGVVIVLNAQPPAELHASVEEAVLVCPAAAITLS
ncbi:ferredoxin [Streptomyces sp. NPDC102360]|uniref:ferredoxin n=1 Tax=Streptomyces sp. NPDC102360 TaxID=3366160 RepID=UPI0037FAEFB0